jgi:uncharacterized protein YjiS (DUF1127 family)
MNSSTIESHTSQTNLNGGSWWAALVKSTRQPFAWIRHQRQIRRDIKLLMEFDDNMLADIGLSRSEVLYAVRHGRARE